MQRSELLTPSLSAPRLRPYSLQAMFYTSFFGGLFGVIAFSILNMRRLNTLKRDWWLPLIGTLFGICFVVGAFYIERKYVRYLGVALAFGYLALFYVRNRQILTLEAMLERKSEPGLKVGILCSLFGFCVVLLTLFVAHHG